MRKRAATRRAIGEAATRLFSARGFDRVTMDDIAAAADVGRMTVFNHFARKEDLFFDFGDDVRESLRTALRLRGPGVGPIEALRLLVHRQIAQPASPVDFTAKGQSFLAAIEASETLKARARAIRGEVVVVLTGALSECAGRESPDSVAHLSSELMVAVWTVAYLQAHRIVRQRQCIDEAKAVFLAIVDRGTESLIAAVAGTPYV